nr:hypothetical protein [Rhodovibrio salinarum]
MFEQSSPGWRHADNPVAALQQLGADLVFETSHSGRQRRLGHVEPGRRAMEMEFLGDGNELPQLAQIDHQGLSFGIVAQRGAYRFDKPTAMSRGVEPGSRL